MNRGDFFLLCVQTGLLLKARDMGPALVVLRNAAELDDAAYGGEKDLGKAAQDFVEYHLGEAGIFSRKRPKPDWLLAWEEGLKNRVQVWVNDVALCHEWWAVAGDALADSLQGHGIPFPRGLEDLVTGRVRGLLVSKAQATQLETWGMSLPGWDQQPFTFEEPAI